MRFSTSFYQSSLPSLAKLLKGMLRAVHIRFENGEPSQSAQTQAMVAMRFSETNWLFRMVNSLDHDAGIMADLRIDEFFPKEQFVLESKSSYVGFIIDIRSLYNAVVQCIKGSGGSDMKMMRSPIDQNQALLRFTAKGINESRQNSSMCAEIPIIQLKTSQLNRIVVPNKFHPQNVVLDLNFMNLQRCLNRVRLCDAPSVGLILNRPEGGKTNSLCLTLIGCTTNYEYEVSLPCSELQPSNEVVSGHLGTWDIKSLAKLVVASSIVHSDKESHILFIMPEQYLRIYVTFKPPYKSHALCYLPCIVP